VPGTNLDHTNLTRPIQSMPDDVRYRLEERDLMDAYEERPAYQQNDYLGWIARAKRPETREKRIAQMPDELDQGGIYMRMDHTPSARSDE
jgi:uncharacterized protein YdeI (YjbR/CyaY-like superfamily)